MTDRTLNNPDSAAQHQDPSEVNDQDQVTQDAPNVPESDPVRIPTKSTDDTDAMSSSETAAQEQQRQLETGEENPG